MTDLTTGKRLLLLYVTSALFIASSASYAEGDSKVGSKKARLCQTCHGEGGRSTKDTYPILAGQHSRYIVKQLKAFKSGTRKDPIMNDMASRLSEQDMEDVAAFFSGNIPVITPFTVITPLN